MDPALLPLLSAQSPSDRQQIIAQLLSDADAIVKEVVGYRFGVFLGRASGSDSSDAEDVRSEVLTDLMTYLRRLISEPGVTPIVQFRGYVATMSHRACHDFLRRKYPQRARLKNRIRYLLQHVPGFGIWEMEGEWLCGKDSWRAQSRSISAERVVTTPQRASGKRASDLARIVQEVLDQCQSPIQLDDLVQAVAHAAGIKDQAPASLADTQESVDLLERLADPRVDTAAEVERRIFLTRLWDEIRDLPIRQRTVLLMNLRDEENRGVVQLLPLTGVASIRDIADSLLLPHEEFAEIWNNLPLDDESIAARIGATRQQVINLRKSARERLERKMRGFL